ncbi:DNA-DIRECTED RNA polymerase I II [Salix koriyanagi]|uniref:DNA-DIRECTED RNA polymerase I II n=1 Tax=Salix koriyanagi TaxID=2511006 RepID=A0A9Q0VZR0_9ROSI|nr:DNA-DIRECTED RNA polymerase I II [Salix koriyanagi]
MEDLLDFFVIEKLNPDGKKYDKVSRIVARSENKDLYMLLDVHTEIYPIEEKSRYLVLLTETLNADGTLVGPHNAQVILLSLFCFLVITLTCLVLRMT